MEESKAACPVPQQVLKVEELKHWGLYLVDWGYNTKAECDRAAALPGIQVVSKAELQQIVGVS